MPDYLKFEVSIIDIEPRIWRRFLLRAGDASFEDLHFAIQHSIGWENDHVHCFEEPKRRGKRIAGGTPVGELGDETPDSAEVSLNEYFTSKRRNCVYVYDFGDNWHHEVQLLGIETHQEDFARRLLAGERAGPPEDCGGVYGYEVLVEAIQTPEDDRSDDQCERAEWAGDWNPEAFDLKAAAKEFDE